MVYICLLTKYLADFNIRNEDELKPLSHYIEIVLNEFNETLPESQYTGADMLRFMMEQHGHKQKDLKSVMPRTVVSEVINGHRELTVAQIKRLGEFYKMDPSLFMGT